MASQVMAWQALAERIDRLGRENRRLRWAMNVLAIGPVGLLESSGLPDLVLTNDAGLPRVELGENRNGVGYVSLADGSDRERAILSVAADGTSRFQILDRGGNVVWETPASAPRTR